MGLGATSRLADAGSSRPACLDAARAASFDDGFRVPLDPPAHRRPLRSGRLRRAGGGADAARRHPRARRAESRNDGRLSAVHGARGGRRLRRPRRRRGPVARRGAWGQGRIRPDPLGGPDARSRRRRVRRWHGRRVGDARTAEVGVLFRAVPARRQDADRPLRRQGQVRRSCGDRPAGGDRDRQSRRRPTRGSIAPISRPRISKCRTTTCRSSTSWPRARPT